MTDTKVKKTRTARNLESITAGALQLPLADRGKLRDALITSIKADAAKLEQSAKEAASIANGTT